MDMEDQQSLLTIDLGDLDFLCGDIITDEDIQLSQVCEEIEQEHDISEGLCQILSLDVDVKGVLSSVHLKWIIIMLAQKQRILPRNYQLQNWNPMRMTIPVSENLRRMRTFPS